MQASLGESVCQPRLACSLPDTTDFPQANRQEDGVLTWPELPFPTRFATSSSSSSPSSAASTLRSPPEFPSRPSHNDRVPAATGAIDAVHLPVVFNDFDRTSGPRRGLPSLQQDSSLEQEGMQDGSGYDDGILPLLPVERSRCSSAEPGDVDFDLACSWSTSSTSTFSASYSVLGLRVSQSLCGLPPESGQRRWTRVLPTALSALAIFVFLAAATSSTTLYSSSSSSSSSSSASAASASASASAAASAAPSASTDAVSLLCRLLPFACPAQPDPTRSVLDRPLSERPLPKEEWAERWFSQEAVPSLRWLNETIGANEVEMPDPSVYLNTTELSWAQCSFDVSQALIFIGLAVMSFERHVLQYKSCPASEGADCSAIVNDAMSSVFWAINFIATAASSCAAPLNDPRTNCAGDVTGLAAALVELAVENTEMAIDCTPEALAEDKNEEAPRRFIRHRLAQLRAWHRKGRARQPLPKYEPHSSSAGTDRQPMGNDAPTSLLRRRAGLAGASLDREGRRLRTKRRRSSSKKLFDLLTTPPGAVGRSEGRARWHKRHHNASGGEENEDEDEDDDEDDEEDDDEDEYTAQDKALDQLDCSLDVAQAAFFLFRMILSVMQAVMSGCDPNAPEACTVSILNIVSSVAWATEFVGSLTNECAGDNIRALCAGDVADVITNTMNLVTNSMSIKSDCGAAHELDLKEKVIKASQT